MRHPVPAVWAFLCLHIASPAVFVHFIRKTTQHHPDEAVSAADVAAGIRALAEAVQGLGRSGGEASPVSRAFERRSAGRVRRVGEEVA
jgi:hypothetical protein